MAHLAATHLMWWRWAQGGGIAGLGALLAGLFLQPALTLAVLWNAVVPVLPAVFLINPTLWRNVCPLATLTMAAGDRMGDHSLRPWSIQAAFAVGMTLLIVMVPARRFVFNADGTALAVTIAAVALLALTAGVAFQRKAGFCNSICPVLPVERLYGQRPLIEVGTARCDTCVACTPRGCLDRSPAIAVRTAMGSGAEARGWVLTPFGAFAGAFPGFIAGYFTATDGMPALSVYQHVLTAMAASLLCVLGLVQLTGVRSAKGLPIIAAVSLCLYYWWTAPAVTAAWGLPGAIVWGIRAATVGLAAYWLTRTTSAAGGPGARPRERSGARGPRE